jgi:hypothetical protein
MQYFSLIGPTRLLMTPVRLVDEETDSGFVETGD